MQGGSALPRGSGRGQGPRRQQPQGSHPSAFPSTGSCFKVQVLLPCRCGETNRSGEGYREKGCFPEAGAARGSTRLVTGQREGSCRQGLSVGLQEGAGEAALAGVNNVSGSGAEGQPLVVGTRARGAQGRGPVAWGRGGALGWLVGIWKQRLLSVHVGGPGNVSLSGTGEAQRSEPQGLLVDTESRPGLSPPCSKPCGGLQATPLLSSQRSFS